METFEEKQFDFSEWGAFFAFGNKQLEEWRWSTDIKDLIDLWNWLIAKKSNYKEMLEAFDKHNKEQSELKVSTIWLEKIIKYELNNYECNYLWYIEDNVYEVLAEYWANKELVNSIFKRQWKTTF